MRAARASIALSAAIVFANTAAAQLLPSMSRQQTEKAFAESAAPATPIAPRPHDFETVSGRPYIMDGDSIELAGQHIRLLGIDAPESEQICLDAKGAIWRCEHDAWRALTSTWAGREWQCDLREKRDRYGRRLGTCYVGDVDLDRWMVLQGWALSYRRYSPHPYDGDEAAARAALAGLWSGAFYAPWDWRHRTCGTEVLGAEAVPIDARAKLCR